MGLIAFLVAAPLVTAVLLMLFRSDSARRVITSAAAVVIGVASVVFAVTYMAGGLTYFGLPQEITYAVSWVMTAVDIVLCAVILWFAVRYKNRIALVDQYRAFYAGRPFVQVLPAGQLPKTSSVTGSNVAQVGLAIDRATGTLVAVGAIDNPCKGAAGQAVQCANIVLGLPETSGLPTAGLPV